jgi:hypothetical protein
MRREGGQCGSLGWEHGIGHLMQPDDAMPQPLVL